MTRATVFFLAVVCLTANQQTKPATDPVTVAIADAVAAHGSDGELSVSRLRDLNVPNAGDAATIRAKKVTRMVDGPSGAKPHTVWVIVTNKRYVFYHRVTAVELGVCVDETGAIVGGRMWHIDGTPADLPAPIQSRMAERDRSYWSAELVK